jgi:hypothetical protein
MIDNEEFIENSHQQLILEIDQLLNFNNEYQNSNISTPKSPENIEFINESNNINQIITNNFDSLEIIDFKINPLENIINESSLNLNGIFSYNPNEEINENQEIEKNEETKEIEENGIINIKYKKKRKDKSIIEESKKDNFIDKIDLIKTKRRKIPKSIKELDKENEIKDLSISSFLNGAANFTHTLTSNDKLSNNPIKKDKKYDIQIESESDKSDEYDLEDDKKKRKRNNSKYKLKIGYISYKRNKLTYNIKRKKNGKIEYQSKVVGLNTTKQSYDLLLMQFSNKNGDYYSNCINFFKNTVKKIIILLTFR